MYIATAIGVAIQRTVFARENNFYIFRSAFDHLVAGVNLYAAYPALHTDRFKYSPTFALLFAPFAMVPPTVGYALWAAACAASVWLGIVRLLPPRASIIALALAWIGVAGDLQRAQSNALVAGLMMIAWDAFERERQVVAATGIAAGTLVKLFPLAAAMGALLHRRRVRFGAILFAVLAAGVVLPLLATTPASLMDQYASWRMIEAADAVPLVQYGTGGAGLYAGVMGVLRVWFGVDWPHWPVQAVGTMILLLPLAVQRRRFGERVFRLQLFASLLVFCVLFNHQAESPSYVIATIGAAVWYASSDRSALRSVLMATCIVVVNFGSTDLMPRAWYHAYYVPYMLKTAPLVLLWIVMQLELHGVIASRGASELAEVDERDIGRRQLVTDGG